MKTCLFLFWSNLTIVGVEGYLILHYFSTPLNFGFAGVVDSLVAFNLTAISPNLLVGKLHICVPW